MATPRAKLIDYANKFLGITAKRNEAVACTLDQVAAFAAQVREGCRQDLVRLLQNLAKDNLHATGEEALQSLARTMMEGEDIELWGLPDCECQSPQCVYCGRGYATKPSTEEGQ